ncbi:hypothetical protein F9960_17775 [Bacteroides stercoris]|nr:hypothetical protein F9953_17355 [Bacteroides stercoris]KAB5288051.1 hypothetical protein F9945_17795 [Bacteroides stercoris]KAB5296699.1 hypothetical protein F9942_17300 [Bacteroides stercoris]KAB5297208.1 hypothetical protein F9991_17780 [Bacteroides stercoris]KAB5305190.1 hypothetical protein F9960_17775 [Bacteroides stercoris]
MTTQNERLKIWILLLVVAGCGTGTALAQKMVKVSGTVYNIAENRKVPFSDVTVDVYAAKTVAVGEDMKKILDSNDQEKTLLLDQEGKTTTDENGYYEILVPDNGALIFKVGLSPSVLKEVRHQMKIDVSIDEGVMLESVTVTAMRLVLKPEPTAPKMIGNMLIPYNTFKLPPYFGNRFSRLIIQPYVLDCETNDTVTFARPSVYDGKEYALTQERKMGYDMDRDPLRPYIKAEALTTRAMNLDWTDTIIVPDPNRNYSCFAIVNLEDYSASNSRTYQINTCQTKRPMKFLQYNLFSEQMDPLQHKERAQIEKRNTSDKIQLSFLINSDQLTDTPENKQSLAMLRNKLKEIAESPGTVLKEFHVAGTASPDGHYSSNLSLAERRMRKIEQEITSILPQYTLERVYRNPHAEVAPWEEVVKLLERDGKSTEAGKVKEILAKHKDIGAQGRALKQLDWYSTVIVPYLDELRVVNYNCLYEIYREPNDEEVMAQYREKGLKGSYTRYEYWKLFQLITDEKELEALYRRAYEESLEQKHPWALAGNNLAASYLERDTVDTSILEPLIDLSIHSTDYSRMNADGSRTEIVNRLEVVTNQLCMYIKKGDFEHASVLVKILPEDSKFDLLKAYTWALGGYFQGGTTPEEKERAQKTFETIKASSPQNEVVMYMALDNRAGNAAAKASLAKLPQDSALTWYFKATLSAREGEIEFMNTVIALSECFKRDKSFVATAQNDGEFNEDIIQAAMDMSNL